MSCPLVINSGTAGAQDLGEYGGTTGCQAAVGPVGPKGPGKCKIQQDIQKVQRISKAVKQRFSQAASALAGAADGFDDPGAKSALKAWGKLRDDVAKNDPPSPAYKRRVHPHPVGYPKAHLGGRKAALGAAINRLSADIARLSEYWAAGFQAGEREVGAQNAHSAKWLRIQAADAAHFYSVAAGYAKSAIGLAAAEARAYRAAGMGGKKSYARIVASPKAIKAYGGLHSLMLDYAKLATLVKKLGAKGGGSSSGSPLGLGI